VVALDAVGAVSMRTVRVEVEPSEARPGSGSVEIHVTDFGKFGGRPRLS
jgi:hypothetical protein